ncbi:hypothetical protein P6166_00385 [Stenotrophomonas sp. HITSZ_GD]|uniref:hypothetical protein n=1 Tax=Stenotrophomonas sp. HITSZ_GD TaxID=3037248 RepID=UPI00240DB64B|nr:hypothetical protein [Stenotrophomonas sp. HITSZ_GD]MDG2523817.1 hypothetical protein [Stenotrophomonas sp. HITSZ_GD]
MHALSLNATRAFLGQWSRRKALALRAERRLALLACATLQSHLAEVRALLRSGGSLALSDELRGYASRFEAKASSLLREVPGRHDGDLASWQTLRLLAQRFNRDYDDARAELVGEPPDA